MSVFHFRTVGSDALSIHSVIKTAVGALGVGLSVFAYSGLLDSFVVSLTATLLSGFLCVYLSRNRALLLVGVILFYACYSIFYANYFSPLLTTMYTAYRGAPEARVALGSLVLFLSAVILFLPRSIHEFGRGSEVFEKKSRNDLVLIALTVVLGIILVFGFSRPDSLGGERGTPSVFYEYAVILFILAFYFAGGSKIANVITCVMLACFVLQNIIYGGRIMALQYLLVAFFILISSRISSRTYITLLVCGLVLFTFLGAVRTGVSEAGISDFIDAFETSLARGFAWDTAYSSWHTSITFLLYKGVIGHAEQSVLIGSYLLSIFFGGSVPLSQLGELTRGMFFHNYGGVLPVYFQFYFGFAGVVLIGLFVAFLLRFVDRSFALRQGECGQSAFWQPVSSCCALYITVTSFRWTLYSPSQITRGLLLCLIAASLCVWFDTAIKARGRK